MIRDMLVTACDERAAPVIPPVVFNVGFSVASQPRPWELPDIPQESLATHLLTAPVEFAEYLLPDLHVRDEQGRAYRILGVTRGLSDLAPGRVTVRAREAW